MRALTYGSPNCLFKIFHLIPDVLINHLLVVRRKQPRPRLFFHPSKSCTTKNTIRSSFLLENEFDLDKHNLVMVVWF